MTDTYVEVRDKSETGGFFSSLLASLIGVSVIYFAACMQIWNEGRAVSRDRALGEVERTAVVVTANQILPDNENKVIQVSGPARVGSPVKDPSFPVSLKALALRRKCQMYQWRETESTRDIGGGKEETTYSYNQVWSDSPISSSSFHNGHTNPDKFPVEAHVTKAHNASLGKFKLTEACIGALANYQTMDLSTSGQPKLGGLTVYNQGKEYCIGKNPKAPQIGDERVSFQYIPEGQTYSVLAGQSQGALVEHICKNGEKVVLAAPGELTTAELIKRARDENHFLTWGLRLIGVIAMWIGLLLLGAPIFALFEWIPIVGAIVDRVGGAFLGGVAVLISMVIMSFAWITYRPVIGITMIVAGVIFLLLVSAAKLSVGPQETRAPRGRR